MFAFDLLSERARVTPERTALVSVESGARLSYRDLDARVDLAAATLLSLGLQPGDRCGLLSFNCLEFVEIFFGAARAGLIVVPLSTRATAHELEQIARDCDMQALFFGEEHQTVARELLPLVTRQWPVTHRVEIAEPFVSMRRASSETVECLLYTSGTTGKPKGVMIPRRQLYWNGYNTAINWGLREDDVSPVFTPLYHAGGLAVFMIPLFCAGGTVVLHKGFDPSEVWATIERERCTVVLGVPTIWKLLLESPAIERVDLSHVRWFISGGAPLPRGIISAYEERGIAFKQGFGMTEVGVNCFTMSVEDARRKPGSIGRPMTFTEVKLVDEEGAEVGRGGIGEMLIRGPHVSLGYWNAPEATATAYLEGGWFRTGDLARQDEDGFFYVAGRRKEMFISGGVNVYPAEIEGELVAHPAVSDAAVVAVPDETWGETGVAFVVASGVSVEELSAWLATRIAKYKVPGRFVFVESLPRTAYGKVVKNELIDRLHEGS